MQFNRISSFDIGFPHSDVSQSSGTHQVLKIGGSQAPNIRLNLEEAIQRSRSHESAGEILVVSALRGNTEETNTTTQLEKLVKLLDADDFDGAIAHFEERIQSFSEKLVLADGWEEAGLVHQTVRNVCEDFKHRLRSFKGDQQGITRFGEYLAQRTYGAAMTQLQLEGHSFRGGELDWTNMESVNSCEVSEHDVAVMGGWTRQHGKVRGYSDVAAMDVTIRLGGRVVIQKDCAVYDSDPKSNPNASHVAYLSPTDALLAFGPEGYAQKVIQKNAFELLKQVPFDQWPMIQVIGKNDDYVTVIAQTPPVRGARNHVPFEASGPASTTHVHFNPELALAK